MPIAAMLRAYRLGHGFAARRIEQAAVEIEMEPEIRWRALTEAARYFFAYVDVISTQLVTEYEQERARWIRGAAAARAELVTAIIDGQPVDASAASATLRYDVTRHHLAFIVWSEARADQPPPSTGSLEVAATALARELGGGPVLLVPIGERVVWAWTSGDGFHDKAMPAPLRDGLRAALGTPIAGVAGLAGSHHQARAARRVGELLGVRPGTVVRYGSVALTALLTVEPAEAVAFATTQLGELAGDTDAACRLRATLRVYLEENQSPARVARRLGIHQNTVVYRVKRAEEILGHPLDQGRLELEVSLRLSEGLDGLRSARDRGRVDHSSSSPAADHS
jgi:DNA-binding PucR family transcriptional regulator